jgi:hypothetical protein
LPIQYIVERAFSDSYLLVMELDRYWLALMLYLPISMNSTAIWRDTVVSRQSWSVWVQTPSTYSVSMRVSFSIPQSAESISVVTMPLSCFPVFCSSKTRSLGTNSLIHSSAICMKGTPWLRRIIHNSWGILSIR